MRKIFCILVLTLVAICNCAFAMTVKVLNVGQGDAVLIQTGEQNVLIDTSDVDERAKLRQELYKAECYRIDKLILTHPHADHIANAAWLIQNGIFSVRAVYDNGKISANKYYRNYLKSAADYDVPHYALKTGDVLDLGGGATFTVLASAEGFKNVNDDSICARLTLGDFSMILTGDAEVGTENLILDGGATLASTVLKAGHHGSKTSNSLDFVRAVSPQFVIISAGEPGIRGGNSYGHPHATALENFLIAGVDKRCIFWTYKNGTVTIDTDGATTTVSPEVHDVWIDEYLGYRLTVRTIG